MKLAALSSLEVRMHGALYLHDAVLIQVYGLS
jgi:hypothetical protein